MIDLRIGGVPEHFNYPWYLTLKAKKHQQSGINLRWIDFDGGTGAMIEGLTNKTIDLGVVLTEGVVKAIAVTMLTPVLAKWIGLNSPAAAMA